MGSQLKVVRQLLTAAFIDQVAIRKDLLETDSAASGNKYATSKGVPYRALGVSEDVFIHPTSVLFNNAPPEYLIFHEVIRTSQVWIKGRSHMIACMKYVKTSPTLCSVVTRINAAWLSSLGKSLCTFSKPVKNREGVMMVVPKFGEHGWELPLVKADSI
jgi:ATP-dependent RNA helicase DHX37/DHR1